MRSARVAVGTLSLLFVFFVLFDSHFGRILGTSRDPKIDKKSFFCSKRRAREQFFDDFCGACLFSRFFRQFSFDFSSKIDVFSSVVSLLIACFFELGDPHDSVYFIIRKLFFHFSCFFIFTTKIIKNRCENTVPKNNQKIMVWASILGPKIDENRRRKARKAPKL